MSNKTQKLRAVAVREIKLAKPSRLDNRKVVAALSQLSRTFNNVDELQKQADLLHVEAVLVTEGINDNDDAFMREELKKAISSPILKPMNWQHKEENILGAMYAVEARDLEGNALDVEEIDNQPIELVIQGVVWHYLPHIKATAEEIVRRINESDLFVSMECWFDDYEYCLYTRAGELFDRIARKPETVFLDGYLRSNGGVGSYNGMRIGRALSGVSFGGIAFVDRPANKRSYILNHFAFDPVEALKETDAETNNLAQDQVVTQTTLFSKKPMEVNMNSLNHAVAGEEIKQSVEQVLEARDRAQAAERTKADLETAKTRNAELEDKLVKAQESLGQLQKAIDEAYAGATSNTPDEIVKIDDALKVKDGAGDATWAAKIAWIANSRKAVAQAYVETQKDDADQKLVEENKTLKAELDSIKKDLRKREIEYLFADVLEMSDEEVTKFVEAGLAKASDEDYNTWLDEQKIFAKKLLEMKKQLKKGDEAQAADDAEAGLLSPSQRETSIDDLGATLRSLHGRSPADLPRTPRSKLTAAADIATMFEEDDEPNLAGSTADEGDGQSPMAGLVNGLLDKKKEV